MDQRWSEANTIIWQREHKWPIGFNYVTSDAVNSLEMWMNDTFHPDLIDKELNIAEKIGFNSVRVFLSFTVWEHEKGVFENNFDCFLRIASKHQLSVMPIIFDDCAFDFGSEPQYGLQHTPVPGVHNSRWVPCPGFQLQDNADSYLRCKEYVDAIIGKHRDDPRIIVWDLYNEPGNTNRFEKCLPLLQSVFSWARALEPTQPLTSGLWRFSGNDQVNRFQLDNSDIISIHAYSPLEKTRKLVEKYRVGKRPFLITEWLHRPAGNIIHDHLPYFWQEKIGIWQWGMIVGKTQTNLSWSTMNGGTPEPNPLVWQHDIIRSDGTPFDTDELKMIRYYGDLSKQYWR